MSAKISIITPVYNSSDFLEYTLKNLYSQTYNNFEHVIIDNLSTDNSLKIVNNFKFKNRLIISAKDNGVYSALNKGIKKSNGEIVGLLHSSDLYYSSDYLDKVEKIFIKEKCDILYTNLHQFKTNINKKFRVWNPGFYKKSKIKFGWMPPHCTMFVSKKFYENNLYDEKYLISSDYDWILKNFLKNDIKIAYANDLIYLQRLGGLSTNYKKIHIKLLEDYNILSKFFFLPILPFIFKRLLKLSQFKKYYD
jgi:glycosyltransferase